MVMKQINIFGEVEEQVVKKEEKFINGYYGSELNKLVDDECRRDMVAINIDLIINDYKKGILRVIESKHTREKLGTGQNLLLKELQKRGIDTYVVYGDAPYNNAKIYSYKTGLTKEVNHGELVDFLNNK